MPAGQGKIREGRGIDGEFFGMADRIFFAGIDNFWDPENIFGQNLTCRNLCSLAGSPDPIYDTGEFYLHTGQRGESY